MESNLLGLIKDTSLKGSDFAVLLRHSIREPMGKRARYINHENLHLTEEGRIKAVNFGEKLPIDKPIRIFYSPVERCKETAECMEKGFSSIGGSVTLMGERDFLNVPFHDFKNAFEQVKHIGILKFTRKWLDFQVDVKIIEDPLSTFQKLTKGIISNLLDYDRNHTDFHISHDWAVLLIREYILGIKHEDAGWPDYLDGVIILHKTDQLTVLYQGARKSIFLNRNIP